MHKTTYLRRLNLRLQYRTKPKPIAIISNAFILQLRIGYIEFLKKSASGSLTYLWT